MVERPRRELGELLEEAKSLGDEIESGGLRSREAVARLFAVLGEVNHRLASLIGLPREAHEQSAEVGSAEITSEIQRKDEPLPDIGWAGEHEWKVQRGRGGGLEGGAELIYPDDYPEQPEEGSKEKKKEGGAI